jgi:hypothetical protein
VTDLVPLRRQRDLSTVISDSFTILFASWSDLAMIVAPAVLVGLAFSLIEYGVGDDDQVITALIVLASLPVQFIAYELVGAAVVAQINGRDLRQTVTAGDALDVAQDRFGDVIGAAVRSTVIVVLLAFTIVGIPWAFKRGVEWAFLTEAIIIDGQKGEPSLAYSAALVLGNWWGTFGRLLVSGIVIGLPTVMLSSLISVAVPGVIGIIAASAPEFLALPFGIIATTLIFFDLKLRKAENAAV